MIDRVSPAGVSQMGRETGIEPLEKLGRVGGASASAGNPSDIEALYRALLDAGDDVALRAFMEAYVDAEGNAPFRTASARLTALQGVLARLKEEGLQDSPAWDLGRKALGQAFGMSFMVSQFLTQVMMPPNDEDRPENLEW